MVVILSLKPLKNYCELVLRNTKEEMANIAITGYIIRNKMAMSNKNPPELNPVGGFQSHKICQISDYSFTEYGKCLSMV